MAKRPNQCEVVKLKKGEKALVLEQPFSERIASFDDLVAIGDLDGMVDEMADEKAGEAGGAMDRVVEALVEAENARSCLRHGRYYPVSSALDEMMDPELQESFKRDIIEDLDSLSPLDLPAVFFLISALAFEAKVSKDE